MVSQERSSRWRIAVPRSVRARRYLFAAFAVLFVLSFLLFLSSLLIRGNVLTTGFYLSALDETRAFDRVYDDLLADPEFTDAIEPFFGTIGLDRSYTVSTLRFFAPPDQLRVWSDDAIGRVTDYVRGDVPRYSGEIDLAALIDNQRSALVTYVTSQIVQTRVTPVETQSEFEQELTNYVNQLAQGRIGSTIPAATLTPEATERVTRAILRPLNPQSASAIRTQVETYVSVNDIVGALIAAAPALLEDEIERANQEVLAAMGGDANIDIATTFADIVQESGNNVVSRLDELRSRANTLSPVWLPWVAIGLMAIALAGVIWITNGTRKSLNAVGLLFAGTGTTILFIGFTVGPGLVERLAGRPLEPAFRDGPQGWNLPQSARVLIDDIQTAMFTDLSEIAAIAGLILALTGIAVITVGWLTEHVPAAIRGRYNWVFARETTPLISVLALGGALVPLLILNSPDRPPELTCNGHTELCDLHYNEVTFPATHNSMSNSADGWLLPTQDVTMRQQMDDGVRALLVDTQYWQDPATALARLQGTENIRPDLLQFVEQLLSRFGSAPEGTYLCHLTCWLGAVRLTDALIDVREFLEENPGEVVTLIIQDAISAADTELAFQEAGLLPFLFQFKPGDNEWPTLRTMVTTNQRLVVMAEQGSAPPEWYINAWTVMQETPFNAKSKDQLTCEPNRGAPDNRLFLMNHWINRTPPDRVDAAGVNSAEMIVSRARECESARGLKPNFVAVNFYRQGELFKAVDELNGLIRQ